MPVPSSSDEAHGSYLFLGSFLFNRLNPQAQSLILARRHPEIWAEFFVIALLKYSQIEGNGLREVLYIIPVHLLVALQLAKSEIVRIERKQSQVGKGSSSSIRCL